MAHPLSTSALVNRVRGMLESDIDPEELPVLVEEIDLAPDERQEPSGEVRDRRKRRGQLRLEPRKSVIRGPLQEILSVAEVEVQGALRHSRLIGDLLHGRPVQAFARDDPERRGLDFLDAKVGEELGASHGFERMTPKSEL